MANSCDPYLPEELVIEILSRLPVKSLLRFQCVSKLWYNLIKNPTFIDKHFNHPNNQTHLVLNSYIHKTTNICTFSALFPGDTPIQHHSIDTHYLPKSETLLIKRGPINGIFLVQYYEADVHHLALWNPATKEFRSLPLLPSFLLPTDLAPIPPHLGFGLDPVTKVYKVVLIQHRRDECTFDIKISVVGLYTLDTHSWKQIHPVLDSVCYLSSGNSVFLDGAYYWVSYDFSIVLFDMSNEVFQEIEGPPNAPAGAGHLMLHNDDSIALLIYSRSFDSVGIWVTKPEERCWTKYFDIGLVHIEVAHGFWKKDMMIVTTRSNRPKKLAVYNPNNDEIRNLGICGHYFRVFFNYKESLCSLKQ